MKRFQLSSFFKDLKPLPIQSLPIEVVVPKQGRKSRAKPKPKPEAKPKEKAKPPKYQKQRIPTALREQVWIHRMGRSFEGKCPTSWCQNNITVFDFQSGHNVPESKGGPTTLENLIPLCSRCNLSMGNDYTFDEWSKQFQEPPQTVAEVPPPKRWWCSFSKGK